MVKTEPLFLFIAHELSSCVRVFSCSGGDPVLYTQRIDFQDFFLADSEHEAAIMTFAQDEGPVMIQVQEEILYGLVQTNQERYLIGPVRVTDGYALRCQLSWVEMPASIPSSLPPCSLTQFAELALLLHNCFADHPLTLNECLMDNSTLRESGETRKVDFSRQVHEKIEEVRKHNP